jgi:hypothetical protein
MKLKEVNLVFCGFKQGVCVWGSCSLGFGGGIFYEWKLVPNSAKQMNMMIEMCTYQGRNEVDSCG